MSFNNLSLLFTAGASLILAVFVYLQGRNKSPNIFLALLALSIGGWCFGELMGEMVAGKSAILFWTRANIGAAVLIPAFYLNFILAFCGRIGHKRVLLSSAYLSAGALLLFDLTSYFVADIAPRAGFRFYPVPGPVYPFFAAYLFFFFIAAFRELLSFLREAEGAAQNQARYVFWASIIGFIGGITAFFPVFGLGLPVVSHLVLPLYLAILAYAIVIYKHEKTIDDLSADNLKLYRSLLQADKMAALGVVAAGMAHEIKNPLAAIKGLTQVLPENLGDPEFVGKYSEIVPRQLDRINRIVEDLLDFGQPKELRAGEVKIEKLLDDILRLLENQCRKANIDIVKEFGLLPLLFADSEKLSQAFINIILNAIQAMDAGGVMKIKTFAGGGKARIEISDTGAGIPAERLLKIFDPFYTTKEAGTGMGLAVTYRIIAEHGGEIEVESAPGKGTIFKICLPIKPEPSV